MSYGNASGGHYNTLYRTLIIEDSFGNNQLISFCVIASAKCNNDPLYGNSTGKSVLVVSIDDFNKSHNSLQLNMNKFLNIVDSTVTITHSGAIAVGNIGSGKISELKKFIKNKYPELLNDSDEIMPDDLRQFKVFRGTKIDYDMQENIVHPGIRQIRPKKTKEDIAKEMGISRTTLWRMTKQNQKKQKI